MPNKIFTDLVSADINALVAESQAINTINHPGLKGNIREYGLGKLLSKYLPFEWDIGKGQIHDFKGLQSAETDLLVYNKNILPPIFFGEGVGLYPIESVYYSFEIKTRSTAAEVQSTIRKFQTLQKLIPIEGLAPTRRVYFALSSDLSAGGIDELERYKKYDPNFYTNPAVLIICVLGQGYWFYEQQLEQGKKFGRWKFSSSLPPSFELVMFLGGMINTLNKGKPPFGFYILPEGFLTLADEKEI